MAISLLYTIYFPTCIKRGSHVFQASAETSHFALPFTSHLFPYFRSVLRIGGIHVCAHEYNDHYNFDYILCQTT